MAAALRSAAPSTAIFDSWVRQAVIGSVVALLTLGGLLIARRVVGALSLQLPIAPMAMTALLAAAIVASGRIAWRRLAAPMGSSRDRRLDLLIGWGGSLALVLLFVGCCFPEIRVWDWFIWSPLIVADQFQRQWFFENSTNRLSTDAIIPPLVPPFEGGGSIALDEQVLQQLVRVRDADGQESIHGTLRAEFDAGQRHATLHVGFCPPLAALPNIEAEPVDGPDSEVKLVQALAHGARLDVRLAEPAEEPCWVLVELSAASSVAGPMASSSRPPL